MMEILVGVLAIVGVLAATAAISRLVATVLLRYEPDPERVNGPVGLVWLVLGFVIAIVALVSIRLLSLASILPTAVALVANVGLFLSIALLSTGAWRWGYAPIISARSIPTQFRRRLLIAVAIWALPIGFLAELAALGISRDTLYWIPLVVIGLWALVQLISLPCQNLGPYTARDPTPAERDRLSKCFDSIDSPLPAAITVDTIDNSPPQVAAVGRGPLSSLYISEEFMNGVDDETLTTILAQAVDKNDAGFHRYLSLNRGLSVVGILFLGYAIAATVIYHNPIFLIGFLYLSFACTLGTRWLQWKARQATFDADNTVSELLGAERVTTIYSELGEDLHQLAATSAEPGDDDQLEPGISERIAILSGDRSTGSSPPATLWQKLVGLFSIAWAVGLAMLSITAFSPPLSVAIMMGPLVPLSLCLYLDTRAVQGHHELSYHRLLYVLGGVVPLFGPTVGGWYLLAGTLRLTGIQLIDQPTNQKQTHR